MIGNRIGIGRYNKTGAFPLDGLPGFSGAWSTRQLVSGVGNLVRLREDNGNTEDDFSISDDELKNGSGQTVPAWLIANSATNAYVVKMYDQAGANDATQTTALNQPLFDATGYAGGKPAGNYDGTQNFEIADFDEFGGNGGSHLTVICWAKSSTSQSCGFFTHYGTNNQIGWWIAQAPNDWQSRVCGDGAAAQLKDYNGSDIDDGVWRMFAFVWDSGNFKLYVDGSEIVPTKSTDDAFTEIFDSTEKLGIGAYFNGFGDVAFRWVGEIESAILSSHSLTDDQIMSIYERMV